MSNQGERIKKIRKKLGYTQEDFAKFFDFSRAFVSAVEKNTSQLSVKHLITLLNTFDVNINYVLVGKGEMFNAPQNEQVKNELAQEIDSLVAEALKRRGF